MTNTLDLLTESFKGFPTIGEKTAKKMTSHILKMTDVEADNLLRLIATVKQNVKLCGVCCAYTTENVCRICNSQEREKGIVCVVQESDDIHLFEQGSYEGVYHVLHGRISPQDGVTPEDIKLRELILRCQEENIQEVILATDATLEGEATAAFIRNLLNGSGITVSRLSSGLPMGASVSVADAMTLNKAIEDRKVIS